MELNVLKRGERKWKKVKYVCAEETLDKVTGAAFRDKCFYFLDKEDKLLTYSVKKREWEIYRMLVDSKVSAESVTMPFYYQKSSLMGSGILKSRLNLGEDVSISTCGTFYRQTIVHNEEVEASEPGETQRLKGIWIYPRFHQVPANQRW